MIRRSLGLLVGFILLVGFLIFVLPSVLPRQARSRFIGLFYQDRRPTPLGRNLNRAWTWAAAHHLTPTTWPVQTVGGTIALETRGRRTGELRQNVITWVEQDGERYFVSMLGHQADWVLNVRAAGGNAAIRHGDRRNVLLEEVPTEQRAPILLTYVRLTGLSTSDHLGVEPNNPPEDFQRIAPNHPVFRIVELDSDGSPQSTQASEPTENEHGTADD